MALSTTHEERARFVRAVLAWHDVTQADLGRLLGISQQSASRKLAGLTRFTADELDVIAHKYGVDPGMVLRPARAAELLGPFSGLRRTSSGRSPSAGSGSSPRKSGCIFEGPALVAA